MKTVAEMVKIIKDFGLTKSTINELMAEIVRIKGSLKAAGIVDQESTLAMLVEFIEKLDGKIEKIYNNGINKIINS